MWEQLTAAFSFKKTERGRKRRANVGLQQLFQSCAASAGKSCRCRILRLEAAALTFEVAAAALIKSCANWSEGQHWPLTSLRSSATISPPAFPKPQRGSGMNGRTDGGKGGQKPSEGVDSVLITAGTRLVNVYRVEGLAVIN